MPPRRHGTRLPALPEAQTAFFDEEAAVFDDPDHSDDEDRFLLLGLSSLARVLVVVHCLRNRSGTIRIISAWKAARSEREAYARGAL